MAHIPQSILNLCATIAGLELIHRGKVRDSYDLPGHEGLMLVVASDRISIFDFVLPALVPFKGEVLTAMTHFWTTKILTDFQTDFVAAGPGIDRYLPEELRGDAELQKRAVVVRKLSSPVVEDIVRGYITGSGLKSYQSDGKICGHELPAGLKDGNKLLEPIYTPTTKAKEGHDEHLDYRDVVKEHGQWHMDLSLGAYGEAARYALEKGLILVDTKLEMSDEVIADEKFTPDSSRYWDLFEWTEAQKKGEVPSSMDKQYVRNYGKKMGINRLEPTRPEDLARVDATKWPRDILERTRDIYLNVFLRLTGSHLGQYQRDEMGVVSQEHG